MVNFIGNKIFINEINRLQKRYNFCFKFQQKVSPGQKASINSTEQAGKESMKSKSKLYVIGALAGTLIVSPANAIIIGSGDVNPPGLGPGDSNITGQTVRVENGTLTVNGGNTLTADAIRGADTLSTTLSEIEISGPGTTVNLVGETNRFAIGVRGKSNVIVSGGAVVNANSGVCRPGACGTILGQQAGSTAAFTITGSGSQVNLIESDSFFVGFGSTSSVSAPGATTTVNLNILDGGILNSGRTSVGPTLSGPPPAGDGTENVNATIVVDGEGSRWNLSRLSIADDPNHTGVANVRNSGSVRITDGLAVGNGGTGTMNIESSGEVLTPNAVIGGAPPPFQPGEKKGTLNISGTDSSLRSSATGVGFVAIGLSTEGALNVSDGGSLGGFRNLDIGLDNGNGNINITNGGSINKIRFVNAGRNGGTANITVDGENSLLQTDGLSSFVTIGRNGTASLDVKNGGTVDIVGTAGGTFPGFQAGRDGKGTISVTGPGSKIKVTSSETGFVNVGRNNGSDGTINITDGGKVLLNTEGKTHIGRNVGAKGKVLISGAGSEYDGGRFIGIGLQFDEVTSGGDGMLTVENNGIVRAETIGIGANGVLKGSGGVVDASVVAFDGGMVAPGSSPGDMGILGGLDLRNGGVLQIEIGGVDLGDFDRLFVGGDVLVDGTTSIVFSFIDGAATDPDLLVTDFIDINAFLFDIIDPLNFDINDPTADSTAFDPALWTPAQFSAVGQGFDREVFVDAGGRFSFSNGVPVPEPGTMALFAIGLVGLGMMRRRQKLAA